VTDTAACQARAASLPRARWLLAVTQEHYAHSGQLVHTEEITEVSVCPFPGVGRETGSRDH